MTKQALKKKGMTETAALRLQELELRRVPIDLFSFLFFDDEESEWVKESTTHADLQRS